MPRLGHVVLGGLVVSLGATSVVAAPTHAASPRIEVVDAESGGYRVHDLGAESWANAVNNEGQVTLVRTIVVTHPEGPASRYWVGEVWSEEAGFTRMGGPDGQPSDGRFTTAYPADINDEGDIIGSAGQHVPSGRSYSHPARWAFDNAGSAPTDLGVLTPNFNDTGAGIAINALGDSVSFSALDNSEGSPRARAFLTPAGTTDKTVIGGGLGLSENDRLYLCGIADDGSIMVYTEDDYRILSSPEDTGTVVDVDSSTCTMNNSIGLAHPMASDGTVVGQNHTVGTGQSELVVRHPDGDLTTDLTPFEPNAVNADAVVAGSHWEGHQRASIWHDGTVTDLHPLLPSGATSSAAVDISDNGDVVGWFIDSAGKQHGFVLEADGASIQGEVLRGSGPGAPYDPGQPARGVVVEVEGTTAGGEPWSGSGTSNATGRYTVAAPAGDYTATFPGGVCVNDSGPCDRTAELTVPAGGGVTQDAVATTGNLAVTVKLDPKNVTLLRHAKTGATTPKKVIVKVVVANTGPRTVRAVQQPDALIVGHAPGTVPAVPEVPVVPLTGPVPSEPIGSLKPGRSRTVTYTLRAKGDGKYDVDALVTGTDSFGTLLGSDTARLTVGAPVLVSTFEMGKRVKSPDAPKLVKGGSVFTVDVTFENRSYLKQIIVKPLQVSCRGNAQDCHLQLRNLPIQDAASMDSVVPTPFIALEPRQERKFEIVVRTTNVAADVMLRDRVVGGGTRAMVKIAEPKAHLFEDGELGDPLKAAEVFVDGPDDFQVGIDVRDFFENPEPETWQGYLYYISKGVMQGLWNITTGMISGILIGLPTLVGKAITSVPGALVHYTQAQVELYDSIKDDPVLLSLYLNAVTNATLLAYQEAPGLIEDVDKLRVQIEEAVLAKYTTMHNDWFAGDWRSAVTAFGAEGTERAVDIGTALAPGILSRFPRAQEAFNATKARVYAQVTEDLSVYAGKVMSVLEAVEVLAAKVKPGFAFTDVHLRQLYGLTQRQAEFLRTFAQENNLLIVVRSRAAESVKWIKRWGAVLKPESIKLKNVAHLDAKYLGYRFDDIGRVVVRRTLPALEQVKAKLRQNGFKPGDPEFEEVLKRLATREDELQKAKDGYVKWMDAAHEEGSVDMRWNFRENSVDPTAYTDTVTSYPFRLRPEGRNEIPEFFVDDQWRPITGDVDFLQISHGNGAALSDAERVRVYQQLARSPVGFLHPESATWTDIKNNLFDFETKTNEFIRGGTVAQFAPDGAARAVTFNEMSAFTSKLHYRVVWNGGYTAVGGKVAP